MADSRNNKNTICYVPSDLRSKYSYFYVIPSSASYRNKARILLYCHGSPKLPNYKEMVNHVRNSEIPRILPFCEQYGYILLCVVTPRNFGEYPDYKMNTQSFAKWTMFKNDFDKETFDFYKRPDIEFRNILLEFQSKLDSLNIKYEEKVFITGFSNGGAQSNRFSILHPEIVKAVAIGGAGAFLYPSNKWKNTVINYPIGIANIDKIGGSRYDFEVFKKIKHFVFVGEKDLLEKNDPTLHDDNFDPDERDFINNNFGKNNVERAEKFSFYLKSIGMDCTFKLYKGIGHEYSIADQMRADTMEFFDYCV